MVALQANNAGTWQDAEPWVNRSGTWEQPLEVHAKLSGVWTKVWSYGNDQFTKLLITGDGSVLDSSSSAHTLTLGSPVTVDSTQSVFGRSSIRLPGSGSYIRLDSSADFTFGTDDFTIELWLRYASFSSTDNKYIYDARPSGGNGAYPLLYLSPNNTIRFFNNSGDRITGSALTTNTWYHVALTRASASTRLFVNGSQVGSTYADTVNYINAPAGSLFGANNSLNLPMNGWMEQIRISKGIARWTGNFTPPSQPYS